MSVNHKGIDSDYPGAGVNDRFEYTGDDAQRKSILTNVKNILNGFRSNPPSPAEIAKIIKDIEDGYLQDAFFDHSDTSKLVSHLQEHEPNSPDLKFYQNREKKIGKYFDVIRNVVDQLELLSKKNKVKGGSISSHNPEIIYYLAN